MIQIEDQKSLFATSIIKRFDQAVFQIFNMLVRMPRTQAHLKGVWMGTWKALQEQVPKYFNCCNDRRLFEPRLQIINFQVSCERDRDRTPLNKDILNCFTERLNCNHARTSFEQDDNLFKTETLNRNLVRTSYEHRFVMIMKH